MKLLKTIARIQIVKYAGVGGVAALVEWTTFGTLVGIVHLYYLSAVAVSFVLATATNYLLCTRFVFTRGRHAPHKEFVLLYAISGVGLLANLLLMRLFVGTFGFPALGAKMLCTGMIFFWNFGARKSWVFVK